MAAFLHAVRTWQIQAALLGPMKVPSTLTSAAIHRSADHRMRVQGRTPAIGALVHREGKCSVCSSAVVRSGLLAVTGRTCHRRYAVEASLRLPVFLVAFWCAD